VVVDGYVRVSQVRGREGERFMSPTLQREQIFGWAASHAVQIGELFEELDQSGARRNRPQLERALRRIEAGESGGLVVATTDRFGRSALHGLLAIERIRARPEERSWRSPRGSTSAPTRAAWSCGSC
jgi:DNA invertase Pin-like site-specific DNA recombinase